MEQLFHFSHDHLLNLVHMQSNHNHESSDGDEEEEKEEDFVSEDQDHGQCNMCKEQIYSFHLCYYDCGDCNYSLHKFCAEMPTTLQSHPLHPSHDLTLDEGFQDSNPDFDYSYYTEWICNICNYKRKNFYNYHCSICKFNMDIICATMSQQNMEHASHPHQLQRNSKKLVSRCNACGEEHQGTFYHCTTCYWFSIHLDCALLPAKLLIQQHTNGTFTHPHPLTLTYSFPQTERKAKFYPSCRVCNSVLHTCFWIYKCDKCRYYVHPNCATSKTEPFMSILGPGRGKTSKNFNDDDHPNLLRCPFPDESYNLIKHQFSNQKEFVVKESHQEMINHFSHEHPLILLDTQTSFGDDSLFLHNPMKKTQLLCDGCVKPITAMPFYKCSQDVHSCGFFLHEWCAKLPSEVQNHPGHPDHTLVLLLNIHHSSFGVFYCSICKLPSNSFVYGCTICTYYVDINCAFLPTEIVHEAHPDHLLSRIKSSSSLSKRYCNACDYDLVDNIAFHCSHCDFYLGIECAFLLPKIIRHKHDKHPWSLTYNPVENHPGEYFCEICEDEFDPERWFYHCSICIQSMHPECAPVILDCEQVVCIGYNTRVFKFIHVKCGGTFEIKGHPHRLAFVQGIKRHGYCKECYVELQYMMILKCLECDYACHYNCATPVDQEP